MENQSVAAAVADENHLIQQAVRQHLEQRVVALNVQVRDLTERNEELSKRLAEHEPDEDTEVEA